MVHKIFGGNRRTGKNCEIRFRKILDLELAGHLKTTERPEIIDQIWLKLSEEFDDSDKRPNSGQDHFLEDSSHCVPIVINGKSVKWCEKTITYESLVACAAFGHTSITGLWTITYSKGEFRGRGSLTPGTRVEVVDGMIFNVVRTDNA